MEEEEKVKYYVAGLIAGEGGFSVGIYKGVVQVAFSMVNTSREILELVKKVLNCGEEIRELPLSSFKDMYKRRRTWEFRVRSYKDLADKVIPFIERYSIIPLSRINAHYGAVKEVVEMMKRGEHLTGRGLQKIQEIVDRTKEKKKLKASATSPSSPDIMPF
jgi:hypothetical protein